MYPKKSLLLYFLLCCVASASVREVFLTWGEGWNLVIQTTPVSSGQHSFLMLLSPFLGDSSSLQAVCAPCSCGWDSFWLQEHWPRRYRIKSWSASWPFTWSPVPSDSAAVNSLDSQGSSPWLCRCYYLLVSTTASTWPWLWPFILQTLL